CAQLEQLPQALCFLLLKALFRLLVLPSDYSDLLLVHLRSSPPVLLRHKLRIPDKCTPNAMEMQNAILKLNDPK
ncbi:unnamed protein product, partial [Microthlaspi erraticum]